MQVTMQSRKSSVPEVTTIADLEDGFYLATLRLSGVVCLIIKDEHIGAVGFEVSPTLRFEITTTLDRRWPSTVHGIMTSELTDVVRVGIKTIETVEL